MFGLGLVGEGGRSEDSHIEHVLSCARRVASYACVQAGVVPI